MHEADRRREELDVATDVAARDLTDPPFDDPQLASLYGPFRPPDPRRRAPLDDPERLPLEPRDLTQNAADSRPQDRYRLAGSASGTGGSHGNPLLDAAAELLRAPMAPPLGADADEVLTMVSGLRIVTREALELEEAAIEYERAAWEAAAVRRRIERRAAAVRRRAERAQQRAESGAHAGEQRSGRPVHVEVDATAWAAVKSAAVRLRVPVGHAVGDLVTTAAEQGLPAAKRGRDRPVPTPVRGRRARRFARLLVDDETWAGFQALAVDADVTAARLVGLVVEAEARRLGWRPEADR